MQRNILRLFWRVSKPHAIQRNLAILFAILAVVVNAIVAPLVLAEFIDRLQNGGITLANSWDLIALYAALIIVGEVLLWRGALYFTWTFEVNTLRDLYAQVFQKLSLEDLHFHANRFGGSLVSQSTKFLGAYERFWDMIIWTGVPIVSTLVGSIAALLWLGLWHYALFLVAYASVFAVIVYFGSRFLQERNRFEAEKSNETSGYLADMVTNIGTVKSFGREAHELAGAKQYANRLHSASTSLKWGVIGATSAFSTLFALGAIGAFIFAALSAQYGIASAGAVYLIFIYALNINRQLWSLNELTRGYNKVLGDADEMTKILSKELELVDHSTEVLEATAGNIEFRDVGFAHDNGDGERVFENFNLAISAGQRVGLVGHSGSGKTTLTRVLLRLSDIDKGTIMIDDQDIQRVTQQSLHETIAYVSQEPILFHRSLAENIAYGKIYATREQIVDAADKANALQFIEKLPDGFDTLVGERGVKLSGGQRQRIAIARALLKDAPILLLDEATSALDSESEKLIQSSLDTLMKGRTSIVIAHRLSTIAKLDRIIVLDQGKIIEDGTHDELLKLGGVYAMLWGHQSGGFIEEQ